MKAKILEKKDLGFAVLLRLEKPEGFDFKPGQHLFLNLKGHKKPISIANTPEEDGILLYIKIPENPRDKEFFEILRSLKEGEEVDIEGPFGKFNAEELLNQKKVIYIAAGSGIAPVRASVLFLKDKVKQIVLYQEKFKDRLVFKEELEKYAEVIPILSRDESTEYLKGHVQEYLNNYVDKDAVYVLVGSGKFIQENMKILLNNGIKKEQIKLAY
jgi:NAD(P)H-flavin reductase